MFWFYFAQATITLLISLFAIVPELKANNSRAGEERLFKHEVIIFLRTPWFRIVSCILLVLALTLITRKIENENTKVSNNELNKRDSVRQKQANDLQDAITGRLESMGYEYDASTKMLISLRDKLKNTTSSKPLLIPVLSLKSINDTSENLRIELRAAGANIKAINFLTSVAAVQNHVPFLLYNKSKVFANGESLGEGIIEKSFEFAINGASNVSCYIVYLKGYYISMDNDKIEIDGYHILNKKPFSSGVLPNSEQAPVKKFFLTRKKVFIKF